jgi:hypothetical protein
MEPACLSGLKTLPGGYSLRCAMLDQVPMLMILLSGLLGGRSVAARGFAVTRGDRKEQANG